MVYPLPSGKVTDPEYAGRSYRSVTVETPATVGIAALVGVGKYRIQHYAGPATVLVSAPDEANTQKVLPRTEQ